MKTHTETHVHTFFKKHIKETDVLKFQLSNYKPGDHQITLLNVGKNCQTEKQEQYQRPGTKLKLGKSFFKMTKVRMAPKSRHLHSNFINVKNGHQQG